MGYELRRWLADRLPAELSSGERVLALEVADLANDRTRRAFGTETLAKLLHRSGFADMKQVGKVLGKLAARGLELRAPILGKDGRPVRDKLGRLVFAAKGHALEFAVPTAECPALRRAPAWGSFDGPLDDGPPESSPGGRSFDGDGAFSAPQSSSVEEAFTGEGPPPRTQRSPAGSQSSPARPSKVPLAGDPSPQATSSLSRDDHVAVGEKREDLDVKTRQAEPHREPDWLTARLMAEHSANADEVAAVLVAASHCGIRNLSAWSASAVGREDFGRRLAELRAGPSPRLRSSCVHSGAEDPEQPGTCLLCRIRTERRGKQPIDLEPVTCEEDAAAKALLAGLIARGRAEREHRERRKSAQERRPAVIGEVLTPEAWAQREAVIAAGGEARAIPCAALAPPGGLSPETAGA